MGDGRARESIQELVEDLRRRGASARKLISEISPWLVTGPSDSARLSAKASAYEHAAELAASTLVQLSVAAPIGAYVASRASIPARGQMWRDIRARGGAISSTWIDEDGPGQTTSMAELWGRIAEEICSSSHLVLYVERSDLPLKGALVEVGMALAVGLEVRIVTRGFSVTDNVGKLLGSWVDHPNVVFVSDEVVAVCQPPTKGKRFPDLEPR